MAKQNFKTTKVTVKSTCNVFAPTILSLTQTISPTESGDFLFTSKFPVSGGSFGLTSDCLHAVVEIHAANSPDTNCGECVADGDYVTTPVYFYLKNYAPVDLDTCLVYRQGTIRLLDPAFATNSTTAEDAFNNAGTYTTTPADGTVTMDILATKCNDCCAMITIPDVKV